MSYPATLAPAGLSGIGPAFYDSRNEFECSHKGFQKAMINGTSIWQMREVSAQSAYRGQNDMRVHFGLGDAAAIDSLIIKWSSDITQVMTQPAINPITHYTEQTI